VIRPSWLGIGAQRSGTTWLVDLLTQHPSVGTPIRGKEMHGLYDGLVEGWTKERSKEYLARFDVGRENVRLGEFTPYYMRAPWVVDVVAKVLPRKAPILVILRDPIRRFESAMRHELTLRGSDEHPTKQWFRRIGSDLVWGGMYASQLTPWIGAFGRDRFEILQYERMLQDPQPWLDRIWGRLGVDPVPLAHVDEPSRTSTEPSAWTLDRVPGLPGHLREIYRPEAQRLEALGIDLALWKSLHSRRWRR
jgi:hypothetical protein